MVGAALVGAAGVSAVSAGISLATGSPNTGTALDPVYAIIQGAGVAGAMVVLFSFGIIVSKREHDRVVAESKRKDDVIAAKDKQYSEAMAEVVPAVAKSSLVLEAITPYLREGISLRGSTGGGRRGQGDD